MHKELKCSINSIYRRLLHNELWQSFKKLTLKLDWSGIGKLHKYLLDVFVLDVQSNPQETRDVNYNWQNWHGSDEKFDQMIIE